MLEKISEPSYSLDRKLNLSALNLSTAIKYEYPVAILPKWNDSVRELEKIAREDREHFFKQILSYINFFFQINFYEKKWKRKVSSIFYSFTRKASLSTYTELNVHWSYTLQAYCYT